MRYTSTSEPIAALRHEHPESAFGADVGPDRPGHRTLDEKEAEVRRKEGGRFIIVARDVASVSHTIVQIATEMSRGGTPLDIAFGWTLGSPLALAVGFVLFGQGDVPNSVFGLLQEAVADPSRRPTVLVG